MKSKVVARCVVEIVVECDGVWAPDTTIEQVLMQAEKDAAWRIQKLFGDACLDDSELATKRRGQQGLSYAGVVKVTSSLVVEKP